MGDFVSVIISAAISFGLALATIVLLSRSGYTDVQRELRLESDRLINKLKDRIALLEAERAEDKQRIEELERENVVLQHRVDRLETLIADKAMG